MKRNILFTLFLLLATSSASALPITHADNPHNMSSLSAAGSVRALPEGSGGTDEICVFCHTPHSAVAESPLWGRPDPDGPSGGFKLYAQPLIIANPANVAMTGYELGPQYPSGTSRMCLSCHDGATSVGVLLGNQTIIMEGGVTNLSTSIDLSTSHPISFNYDANVLALLNPANYQLPSGAVDTPLDGTGQMQCTTCHDPHEDTGADANYDNLPFWRHKGNALSYDDVCSACHKAAPASPSLPHTLP